ncbi:unnamed protein product [Bemisia tabaci]|uniref:Chorion peroxidase n=1 Tax=Bemisia tabaci TaxID=7038 RepID=A0A9P0A5Z8_BEMTA|nr:unnamed protein product [Bemisia tabaci]
MSPYLGLVALALSAFRVRAQLFPEQLQQQEIQAQQSGLQGDLQKVTFLLATNRDPAAQAALEQQQNELLQRLRDMQIQQVALQNAIKWKLDLGFSPNMSAPTPGPAPTIVVPLDGSGTVSAECTTRRGRPGVCKALVKCVTHYLEVSELRSQPCALSPTEWGVCCPRRPDDGRVPTKTGILEPPPPPKVEIPPLTTSDLRQAAKAAVTKVRDRLTLQSSLLNNRILVEPGSPTASHQELFPTTNATLEQGQKAQKTIEASVSLSKDFNLSPDQSTFALPQFSILNTVIADACPEKLQCPRLKYRSIDGVCNNLVNGHWGRVGTAYQRVLPPKYTDGITSPRSNGIDGRELPSARLVSSIVAQDADVPDANHTLMVMQWGQFLDHDLTHTPISRGQGGSGIACCRGGKVIDKRLRHPDCFPIGIPRNDPVFAQFGETCMEFVRSLPAARPECNFGPREQMNQISGYLDASMIYGSTFDTQQRLRLFRGGRLRAQVVRGKELLPDNPSECSSSQRLSCFQAGDGRVNEQIELALMHTIWMREHNRVAEELFNMHPDWSDEALFEESRRIVIAELQHITYNEFLPIVLGRAYVEKFRLTPREVGHTHNYDPNLNGGITNVFAAAAFRFGHSQIQGNFHGYGKFGHIRENFQLSKQHFQPFVLYADGAIDDFVRGLSFQSSQKFDRFFTREVTDHLFQGNQRFGLDLVAFNIQRGRDHGLQPYNQWREVCGLRRLRNWNDAESVMDSQTIGRLANVYGSIDDVDLYIGAVSENPLPGAILGPTFVCLVGDQFARLRAGDRFFYEEGGDLSSFSTAQLNEIRKTSLARVLCDNSDDIVLMQPLAFWKPSYLNKRVPCNSPNIPAMNLRAWQNEVAAA